MTTQAPDELINEHPGIDLSGLSLYGIIRGNPTDNHGWGDKFSYPTEPSPPVGMTPCSMMWRGYIATHRLAADGTFHIVRFRFLTEIQVDHDNDDDGEVVVQYETQSVNEQIDGDFWLVLKPRFSAPRTYLPFRDGIVVEDRCDWVVEEPKHRHRPRK